ncbi:MAG: dicarboxylate/amino acid:cation symporter [Candidatus Gracilibacteria bacterium]|nr:dicarboxylate/amino acid:cation symporter [Candidatus Gracilibacteria bacterium]
MFKTAFVQKFIIALNKLRFDFSIVKFLKLFKRLEVQVISSLILGTVVGCFFPEFVKNFFWMGDVFMKLLKVLLGPLLFFSVIIAILGLGDLNKLGNIGIRTLMYYVGTTIMAILTSLTLMNLFNPGSYTDIVFSEVANSSTKPANLSDFLIGIIPSNIMQSFIDLNAIQIVVISILLGISIMATKNKSHINLVADVFNAINNGILKFISYVIKLTPLGVFAIVAKVVTENGVDSMGNMLPFVVIILLSLFIHAFITLPLVGYLFGKFNPFKYFMLIKEALLLGFSTASSSATMGLTMSVAKEKAKLNPDVVNFNIPLGTTINMNGTALYQAGVALFVSQMVGAPLDFSQQIIVIFIVVLASIGAAGVPGAGMVILTTVFLTLGLPVEALLTIMAFDRILDMFRTSVNIWGDLITAKIVDNYYNKHLKSLMEKIID